MVELVLMNPTPALVAAFVHCCYMMRCHPEDDPECFLSSYSIAQEIEDADEFFSIVSSAFLMMRMSSTILLPPMSLSLAPDWGSHSLLGGACKVK
jgi:hypothetical protein